MKKSVSAFFLAIVATLNFMLFTSIALASPRAIWIWEDEAARMLDTSNVLQDVEDFLERQHISIMFLYADEFQGNNTLVKQPEKYHKLIANAHSRGFKIYALLGSKYLHTQEYILPKMRPIALRMFENILKYNKNAPAASQFDGINIDIEPYLLNDWSSNHIQYAKQYLELSVAFMQMKKEFGSSLLVGPAMPFWYDGIEIEWNGRHGKLNEFVQDIYDYVAIMDYRNVALGFDSITSLAQEELDYADKINKKVMIGVETLKTTPAKVTFYGKGNKYFEEQLALAEGELSRHKSFDGFVIHHLKSYRALVNSDTKKNKR